jgi:hypothetical protein
MKHGEPAQRALDEHYRKCVDHDYPFIAVRTGPGKASLEWDICFSHKLIALMETRGELVREFFSGLFDYFGVSNSVQIFNNGMEGHVTQISKATAKQLAEELVIRLPAALGLFRSEAPWEQRHPLSEDLINQGVVAFLAATQLDAGSTSAYNLYRLLQAYLLDDQKRLTMNGYIGVEGPRSY